MQPTQEQLDNRAEWINALRTGDFKQATNYLMVEPARSGDTPPVCCLGVAACLANVPHRVIKSDTFFDRFYSFTFGEGDDERTTYDVPPAEWFEKRFGLHDANAAISFCGECYRMNDRFQLKFAEIADKVEALFEAFDRIDPDAESSNTDWASAWGALAVSLRSTYSNQVDRV